MVDVSQRYAVRLVANVQTDVTGGGMAVDTAGTYFLNFSNSSGADVALSPIYQTTGGAPTPADEIRPGDVLEAGGWRVVQPIKMGEGWKIFVEASAPISVQLTGRKEG